MLTRSTPNLEGKLLLLILYRVVNRLIKSGLYIVFQPISTSSNKEFHCGMSRSGATATNSDQSCCQPPSPMSSVKSPLAVSLVFRESLQVVLYFLQETHPADLVFRAAAFEVLTAASACSS